MEDDDIMKYIRKEALETSKNIIVDYEELPRYDLFLSQVIDYLNDKFQNEKYTSNIIQNYIKNEVISKPEDGKKRGYTKEHIVQLVLLSYMRPVLTTEEIKKVFKLVFNEINDRSDDLISWEEAYKMFSQIQRESFDSYISVGNLNIKKIETIIKQSDTKESNEERLKIFIVVMTLIAQASTIKNLAQKIVDEYL